MKESQYFEQSHQFSPDQLGSLYGNLKTVRDALLLGWGSILTFAILAFSSREPYFDNIGGVFLWLMLLIGPGVGALVIWKWYAWQQIPLQDRRGVILNGLLLSWATYLSFVGFHLAWNFDDTGFIGIITFIGFILGLLLFILAKRLHKPETEDGELFP